VVRLILILATLAAGCMGWHAYGAGTTVLHQISGLLWLLIAAVLFAAATVIDAIYYAVKLNRRDHPMSSAPIVDPEAEAPPTEASGGKELLDRLSTRQ
jgi:hypothetical protein